MTVPAWKTAFEKAAGTDDGYAWDPFDVTKAIDALGTILAETSGATVGDTKKHLQAAAKSMANVARHLELYDLTEALEKAMGV